MKCIQCGIQNTLQDRVEHRGLCNNCGHPFAFEPTTMEGAKITDEFFLKVLKKVSSQGTLFFTSKQLLYQLKRDFKNRKARGAPDVFMISLLIVVIPDFVFFGLLDNPTLFVVCLLVIPTIITIGYSFIFEPEFAPGEVTIETIESWIDLWEAANGSIEKLLKNVAESGGEVNLNNEAIAYSFDRVLVCDRAEIAQLAIANNFHFENNCAILSIDGYPQQIFSTVMTMLRRNPELKVYAWHDASASGVILVYELRHHPDWFANQTVRIFDLGILPSQIFNAKNIETIVSSDSAELAKKFPPEIEQLLPEKDRQWLKDGNIVESECLTTKRLLRVLSQGIARSEDPSLSQHPNSIDADEDYAIAVQSFG